MSEIIKKRWPVIVVAVIFLAALGVFVWKSNTKESNFDWSSTVGLQLSAEEKAKYDAAAQELKKNEANAEAMINLARLRDRGGDAQGSIKLYEETLKKRPDDTLVLNNLAVLYYSLGDYKKSEETYLRIVETNPKWTSAYRELLSIYRFKLKDQMNTSAVPDLLNKGLEASPEAAEDFFAMLGIYYQDVGNREKAIEYYQKVLDVNPNNAGAASELENLRDITF